MNERTPSSDQEFYDAELHYLDDPAFMDRQHLAVMESYAMASYIRPALATLAREKGRKLRTLELGAGTCTPIPNPVP